MHHIRLRSLLAPLPLCSLRSGSALLARGGSCAGFAGSRRMLSLLSGGAAAAAPLRAARARTGAARLRCAPTAAAAKGSPATERVSVALRGTAVFVVGDNSAANVKLCDALASALGYAPLHTEQLLSQLTGQSLTDIESTDGPAGVALAEAMVLEELSSVARCCVATIGSAKGAAARGDCWRHLFGGITIWLDERADADAPQREAYSLAEVTVDASKLDALSGAELADRTLPALDKLLSAEKDLVGKKSLYVRLGSRGDWPNLAQPGATMPPLLGNV